MTAKQLSVFLENKSGRLTEVTETLGNAGINLSAMSIADNSDFGILRCIVSDPDKAYQVLKDAHFAVKLTDVIAVPMVDQPGSIYEVSKVFGDANINIEYAYAYAGPKGAAVFFRVDDTAAAEAALAKAGMKTLSEKDI